MNTAHYRKLLFGIAAATAIFLPFGVMHAQEVAARKPAVPVHTQTYRTDAQVPVQEVRWGRGYYGGPNGYYGVGPRNYYAPRHYSGYRGYDAPYGGYYPGNYYGSRYGYGPGYGNYYGGGGVRVGRVGIFWR